MDFKINCDTEKSKNLINEKKSNCCKAWDLVYLHKTKTQ